MKRLIGALFFVLMMTLAISLILFGLESCSKSYHRYLKVAITPFKNSVTLHGYLPEAREVPYVYDVEILECGKWIKRSIVIPAGEVYKDTTFATLCPAKEVRLISEGIIKF